MIVTIFVINIMIKNIEILNYFYSSYFGGSGLGFFGFFVVLVSSDFSGLIGSGTHLELPQKFEYVLSTGASHGNRGSWDLRKQFVQTQLVSSFATDTIVRLTMAKKQNASTNFENISENQQITKFFNFYITNWLLLGLIRVYQMNWKQ